MMARMMALVALMQMAALTSGNAAVLPDGASIRNSGSTNSAAYEIALWANGRARIVSQGKARVSRVAPSLAAAFFRDVKRVKVTGARSEPCMKSVSFGSRTTVLYHGWTSTDLSCPGQGAMAALTADVAAITQATGAGSVGRRIYLPSNEPRRMPDEKPPSPSPTSTP